MISEAGEAGADDDHARALAVYFAAGHKLKSALLRGLRQTRGHGSLFTFAKGARQRPKVDRGVELDRMKGPSVQTRCIAGEAS